MNNKLVPAVVAGAAVGAAIALLDKNTRSSVKGQVNNVGQVTKNPSSVKDKAMNIKDEVVYWKDQVEEIRRNNPELEKALVQAKDLVVSLRNGDSNGGSLSDVLKQSSNDNSNNNANTNANKAFDQNKTNNNNNK
ncbi:YtxH domain-containing protein [Macrococcus lamae]|uniref:YtxH domain-containing protein n=1 Tax=Macrococcus lamae TaxID=198484 RepID=UPI0026C35911